jgi:hypothetical protein
MKKKITFEYEGNRYTVGDKAYNLSRIVLPDKRVFQVGWLESIPPKPRNFVQVSHDLNDRSASLIAIIMKAELATEVVAMNQTEAY